MTQFCVSSLSFEIRPYLIHIHIKLKTRMMNNMLKRPVHALALIAVVGVSPSFGFTSKLGNGLNIVHSRSNLALSIASVSEENTQAVADVEHPQPKSYLDDGFVFGLEDSGLARPKGKQGEHRLFFRLQTRLIIV
jgi:hypothetical protein